MLQLRGVRRVQNYIIMIWQSAKRNISSINLFNRQEKVFNDRSISNHQTFKIYKLMIFR